jgi:hypothetical protein
MTCTPAEYVRLAEDFNDLEEEFYYCGDQGERLRCIHLMEQILEQMNGGCPDRGNTPPDTQNARGYGCLPGDDCTGAELSCREQIASGL